MRDELELLVDLKGRRLGGTIAPPHPTSLSKTKDSASHRLMEAALSSLIPSPSLTRKILAHIAFALPEFGQGFALNWTDSFAADIEQIANFCQRQSLPVF